MNPKADFYFVKAQKWQTELDKLRLIVLSCGLTEELKWGCPCYTYPVSMEGKTPRKTNIVLIHAFKEYCALLFFKGALLKDKKGILVQQTENVQAARQMRFTNLKEIVKLEPSIRSYIYETLEVERAGLKVAFKETAAYAIPEELKLKFKEDPAFEKAFNALTPGRQRGYILFFSAAKQSKTRMARIEKCVTNIYNGKGLDN